MTGHRNEQEDPIERVALNIARIVRRHGRRQLSRVQFGLKSVDRPLFTPALMLAIAAGFVTHDGPSHLVPGRRDPSPFAEQHCRTCTCQPSDAPLDSGA